MLLSNYIKTTQNDLKLDIEVRHKDGSFLTEIKFTVPEDFDDETVKAFGLDNMELIFVTSVCDEDVDLKIVAEVIKEPEEDTKMTYDDHLHLGVVTDNK
jgi:hypothetical protein